MTTIEAILKRRMQLPAPKEKVPVTPWRLAGLAVPFLWALVYPVDRVVVLFHMEASWFQELLSFLTALAVLAVLVFSPRDDIVPWEKIAEPRQRRFFFAACGLSLAGVVFLGMSGGDFWTYINLALAVLTLLWLVLPYLALSGNPGALRLLLFAMRMGMVWWTAMFLILVIKDGSGQIMNNSLPAGALGFLGLTYWWFLMTANCLLSGEAEDWPRFSSGWKKRYRLGLALSGCLVLLWVFTGFTNDGSGQYGMASHLMPFPFYDVAAILEPFTFSNGPLLLLHSIPWQKMIFSGLTAGEASLSGSLSGLHWLGLFCLAVAVFGAFGALFAKMLPGFTLAYGVLALAASVATAFQTVSVWRAFASHPGGADYCPRPPEAMHTWECGNFAHGGADHFMLMGQHIPALICCVAAGFLAVALVVMVMRNRAG